MKTHLAQGASLIVATAKKMVAKPRPRLSRVGRLHQIYRVTGSQGCSLGTLRPCSFSSARRALAGSTQKRQFSEVRRPSTPSSFSHPIHPSSYILHPSLRAFSLIEVVLAIGIVSFALLTTIGLFGGIMKTSGDNTRRREMTEAVASLRSHLNGTNFDTAYDWTKSGKEFLYLTYKADTNGSPDSNSESVVGKWTNADAAGLDAYESARSGHWLRAKLSVSPSNPGGTNLPASSGYTRAVFFVLADISAVAIPGETATNSSRLQSTMAISR